MTVFLKYMIFFNLTRRQPFLLLPDERIAWIFGFTLLADSSYKYSLDQAFTPELAPPHCDKSGALAVSLLEVSYKAAVSKVCIS